MDFFSDYFMTYIKKYIFKIQGEYGSHLVNLIEIFIDIFSLINAEDNCYFLCCAF